MDLTRMTPDPFENYSSESKIIGLVRYNYRATKVYGATEWTVVTRFERFGNGKKRQADFEVAVCWRDVENIIEKLCGVGCSEALAVQEARKLATAVKELGWQAPKVAQEQSVAA
jgi:hypothetical protein